MSYKVRYQTFLGHKFPVDFEPHNIESAVNYIPKANDRFVVTYAKCGTHWAQHIINLIVNNGNVDSFDHNLALKSFLEVNGSEVNPFPAILTHMPYNLLPLNDCAKYLLVFRNPKDVCVSHYYDSLGLNDFEGDFHQFFEQWIRGDVTHGDYFEHTLEYWRHKSDKNFQYLVYEEMKSNPRDAVLSIAKFLGPDFAERLSSDEQLLNKVIEKSSFESMKASEKKSDDFSLRKGAVGDWRQHMTPDESRAIDCKAEKYWSGTGLDNLFAEYLK